MLLVGIHTWTLYYIRWPALQIMLTLYIEGFCEGWSVQGIRHMNSNEAYFAWECKWTRHLYTIRRCTDFVENWSRRLSPKFFRLLQFLALLIHNIAYFLWGHKWTSFVAHKAFHRFCWNVICIPFFLFSCKLLSSPQRMPLVIFCTALCSTHISVFFKFSWVFFIMAKSHRWNGFVVT